MKNILLLGASGNIGSQTLDILEKDRESFALIGISVGKKIEKIPSILARFPSISFLCVQKEEDAKKLRDEYQTLKIYSGEEGLLEIIKSSNAEMVVNALVGFAGLLPSITALEENKILCLANKESLVVGGELINKILSSGKGKLYPIDSEHVALAKCLSRVNRKDVQSLVITASGGSFRKLKRDDLKNVTAEDALKHPTWSMGKKITIDSATMFNKGFEVIEAHYLFDWPLENIEVVLHDESYLHSAIKMKDGTYYADVCKPDMHGPIEYALYEGKNNFTVYHEKDLHDFGNFTFHKFDTERYPAVDIAINSLKEGGIKPAILNAAVEESDYLFLDNKIPFLSIEKIVIDSLKHFDNIINPTLEDIVKTDHLVRKYVKETYGGER